MTIRKTAQLTGHHAAVFSLCQGMDAQHFFSAAGDGWVAQWDLENPETGKLAAKVDAQVFSICFLKNQQRLVAGDMNGGTHWMDLQHPETTMDIAHHRKGVFDILSIGEHVFTAGGDGMLTRWAASEGRSLESFQLANQPLRCLDYCESTHEIAAGASDGCIYFLNAQTLELNHVIENAHHHSVFTVKYHPVNRLLLSGGRDAHLKIWDLENGWANIYAGPAHWFTINSIVFHPQGLLFATGSRDKTIKIWDAQSFELLKVLDTVRDGCHVNSVNKLFWSSHNYTLISCSDDRSIILWEIE